MAKILLVEDDNNLREIYGERLLAEGYAIVSARDGEEALSVAITEKPDLIISDVMMPKISGFDMLDILRQTPETKDVKIIMMTALSQAEDKARADMLGANKYLVKSQVTLEDVARVVHDILEEPQKPEQEKTDTPYQPTTESTVQPVVAPPTNDDASTTSQQTDDNIQDNASTGTDDTTQTTVTNDQPEPTEDITAPIAEDTINEPKDNNEAEQPLGAAAQSEQTTEQEQPIGTLYPPSQTDQDQQQDNPEQPLIPELPQEATQQPAEDSPQTQAEQEPILHDEQTQEANIQPQALPVNPIAQNTSELPTLETPQTTPEQPNVNSDGAEPAADELTEVTNQIEDFINNSVTPISEHQEPLTQPSNNLEDNNQQEQPQEPQVEQSSQDNSLENTAEEQDTESSSPESPLTTAQNQENIQAEETPAPQATEDSEPKPEVIDATKTYQDTKEPTTPTEPETPQDNTIPPVIPVEPTDDDQNGTRNPEPASVRKKIISPMHDGESLGTPDINKLYQEEMAKEAEENGLQNPVANSIVSASTNPISVNSGNAELPQLETIDASQIPGISTDGTAPIGIVTPTTTPEQPTQADTTAPEPHEDPNNPNNIAL
ncbi:MAG: hypothetical protein QG562_400 [Patescibacteria group bacterium]|nr:hypothetical protein [Patescibacteria group bacterium]